MNAPLMLLQYAENDPRVNATKAGYQTALKAGGKQFQSYVYPGTRHGFHNYSTPRYNEAAAKLAWERTIAYFKRYLT